MQKTNYCAKPDKGKDLSSCFATRIFGVRFFSIGSAPEIVEPRAGFEPAWPAYRSRSSTVLRVPGLY